MRAHAPAAGKLLSWLVGIILCCTHTSAYPAGFAIDFIGSRSVGTATAGSASASDAATIFFNPAGIVELERNEWIGGGDLFRLHDRFGDQGSTILGGAMPTPGDNGKDGIPSALIPWLFGTYRLNRDLSVGLGIFAPFGLKTDYGPQFVGRYQNELTSLTVLDFNPVVAYRPASLPWLSIGGGVTVEYAQLKLTQAIDFGSACVAALGAAPCATAFGLTPGQSDGKARFKGDDVALGFNLGVLVKPAERSRLSIAFRSRINHRFNSAQQEFDVPAGARAFLTAGGSPNALTGGNARTNLPLPARLSFGWNERVNQRLNLMADATLTMWSTFRTTVITPDDPARGVSVVVDQHYENAWRYALGANYEMNDRWAIRGGVAYDHTPIPAAFVQAALPDRDRVYFSAGTSYGAKDKWSIDVGYSYVHYVGKIPINRATPNGDTLRGVFDVGGHVVAAQLRYQYK